MSKHYHYLGRSGAGGVGYGAPAAVGAALALRDSGILPINVQADGDMMYSPGAFWTAAHHNIPLLTVTHNNLGYHQENMHLQRMSARRQRGVAGNSLIGNELRNPEIDLAQIAGGMGVWSEGPIHDPKDLGPALLRAMDVIDQGEPAFIDCQCQPR
jgi:benzoylformate decarboxylase/acetolactate synthase-1/2/3 large subunit